MQNSKNKPDSTEKVSADIIDIDLIERRKIIRKLPVPHAVERNDDEVWAMWIEAAAGSWRIR